jgi:hypothetical protein
VNWIHLAQEWGPVASPYEHGDGPLDSIKAKDFFHKLSDYLLLKKHFALLS